MEIIFIIMLFCMGTVFGSFFTLAVYRIPLKLDITHERSFCPNCNHRLEFIDLIPILSYLSLKGKCRYCGKPVRIRYLLLELTSGLVFVVSYFAFHFNFPFLELEKIISFVGFVFFYITNCLILGIDKEYVKIHKKVLLFGVITNLIYIIYLSILGKINIIVYGIYLLILFILFFLNWENKYSLGILALSVYELFGTFIKTENNFFTQELFHILTLVATIIISMIIVNFAYKRIKKREKVPYGFAISIASIIYYLIINFIILK